MHKQQSIIYSKYPLNDMGLINWKYGFGHTYSCVIKFDIYYIYETLPIIS